MTWRSGGGGFDVTCPVCGYRANAVTTKGSREPPQDGERTVCVACQAVTVVTGEGKSVKLRVATPDEKAEFLQSPQVQQLVAKLIGLRLTNPEWCKGNGKAKQDD